MWTEDEVASLNAFQKSGYYHPFTALQRQPNGDATVLIATQDGWVESEGGPVVQTWAHPFMLNWTWKLMGEEDTDPGKGP